MKHLNLNLNKTLSPDSNIVLSSQQAIKSYIDSKKVFVQFLQESAPTTFKTGDKWVNTASNKLFIATNDTTWDSGSNLDTTAIYSFGNLLYHYNGTDTKCYSTTSITEQNANKEIKEWFGTQDEYNAIETKDENTHYIIIDDASTSSSLLATQEEFNNSVTDKAATPKQVNEKIGNYLPLAGGNLDKGAILRFTNTNNQVSSMSLDENKYITMSDNLKVSGDINTNSLVSTTGNIYKGNSNGATNIWSDSFATAEKAGIVKVGDQLTVTEDGTLNANTDTLATKAELAGYLPVASKAVANGVASLDANAKVPENQIPEDFIRSGDTLLDLCSYNVNRKPNILFLQSVHDCLYSADKRFSVTLYSLRGSKSYLFDGNFDTSCSLSMGETGSVLIEGPYNFGFGYPYGEIYCTFYSQCGPRDISDVTCRVYQDWTGHNTGWVNLEAEEWSSTKVNGVKSIQAIRFKNEGIYGIKKIELTLNNIDGTAPGAEGTDLRINEINYFLIRTNCNSLPIMTKRGGDTIYGNVTIPVQLGSFIGNLTGTADKSVKDGDGNTISSTYVKVAQKGEANGVASLDTNAKVPENQLPDSVAYQAILREW